VEVIVVKQTGDAIVIVTEHRLRTSTCYDALG
jgi:hypothetical protein